MGEAAESIYTSLLEAGFDVLMDDRERERPGAKFADAELLGIPQRIIVGDRGLKSGIVEVVDRVSGESTDVPVDEVRSHLERVLRI